MEAEKVVSADDARLERQMQRFPKPATPLAVAGRSPQEVMMLALQQGATPELIRQMMDLQERYEATQARKAFNAAFAEFKAEAIAIVKATPVTDGPLKGKHYANLSDIVEGVTPALAKHGLAINWQLTKDDKDWIEVTCTLRHADGHSESVSQGGAPDTGPGRNAIQARGSTKTYLEKYTATAITGLAARDMDDDGNGGKPAPAPVVMMTQEHQATAQAKCEEYSKTMAANVLKSYKAQSFADIHDSEYPTIIRKLDVSLAQRAAKS